MPDRLTKDEKEEIFDKTIGNQARPLKSARTCCICRISSKGRDIISIGELVISVGKRVAHARHFKLAVVGVR